jgi:hypothetical protein
MKINKIALISVALFLLGSMIVFTVIFRYSIDIVHERQAKIDRFKKVTVEKFDKLIISSHWDVFIQQGSVCMMDIQEKGDSLLKPTIKNIQGMLYLTVDSTIAKTTNERVKVRIKMPILNYLEAGEGAQIRIENFTADSLKIVLGNACTFKSYSNTFKKASYKINGEVDIDYIHPL